MSTPSQPDPDALPVEVNLRIDAACDRFEAAWRAESPPRIEDFLEGWSGSEHLALLQNLVVVDDEYRRRRGEACGAEQYQGRFPEFDPRWLQDESADDEPLFSTVSQVRSEPSTLPGDSRPVSAAISDLRLLGDYELLEEIGHGGMGVVRRARDPVLGRSLAIKVLREELKDRPELVRRFVEEAQVSSQLQHPGIPPVHELGRLRDGRPAIVMKLIEGHTLADLLADRAEPGQELPRFLKIFEQVCQTLAYAHSRGVLHRDLKPVNVMVGAFGEVQVMDWGLAKVLTVDSIAQAPARSAAERVSTVRTNEPELQSHAGEVLGTFAYMSPEQARGEVDRLDERCDVFGLGAILCVLLTGRPPYVAPTASEVHDLASNARLAPVLARLDGCGADADLVRLARVCLSVEAGARPRDGGAVATAMAAYFASVQERLQAAERQRVAAEAKAAEQKRRRRVQLALAAAVALLLLGGGAFAWWSDHQAAERRREEDRIKAESQQQQDAIEAKRRTERAVEEARARLVAEQALGDAEDGLRRDLLAKTDTALQQGERRLGDDGPADLRDRLAALRRDREMVRSLDRIRDRRWVWSEGKWDLAGARDDYSRAFRAYGLDVANGDPRALAGRMASSAIGWRLRRGLDDWLVIADTVNVRTAIARVMQAADPDPFRTSFRAALAAQDRARLQELGEADFTQQPPAFVAMVGGVDGIGAARRRAVLQEAWQRRPDDFVLAMELAPPRDYKHKGTADLRLAWYRIALGLRPDNHAIWNNLGNALFDKKELDEAIRCFHKAIALDPDMALAHCNLGNALRAKKEPDEAICCYHKAIELDPNCAPAHTGLGAALYDKMELDEAIRCFHKAIALDPSLAEAHCNLGNALRAKKELDEAICCYHKAIELDPNCAPAYTGLGNALHDKKQLDEAIRCHRKAIELDGDRALAHYNLGNALHDKKQLDEAIGCYRKAIELDPGLAMAHYNLGVDLLRKKELDEAIRCFHKAIELEATYAPAHSNLGVALRAKKQLDEAICCYRKAIELDPGLAMAHYSLGNALYDKKEVDEAICCYYEAISIQPDFAEAHCNLGEVLLDLGRFTEALASLRRGHELGMKTPGWRYPTADLVRQCERLVELDRKLPAVQAGEAQTAGAAEQVELASFCRQYKRAYAASARLYADAFAADPKLAADLREQHRFSAALAAALAATRQGEDAKNLPEKVGLALRRQALAWLRADLDAYARLAESDDPAARQTVRQRLEHWQKDTDLAGLRDPDAISKLPPQEREACRKLWADVATLLERTQPKPDKP
jgi:tetratricopeptide (TPR) repeat protein